MHLNVLFVIDHLGAGGAERSLAELLPELTREGLDVTVACLRREGEGVEHEVLAQGFDVRFLSARRLVSRILELRRLIRAERPEVVHTVLFEADLVGRLAAVGLPVAVVTSLVNTTYDPARRHDPRVGRSKLAAARTIDAWTARHLTDHFHALTEAVKRSAVATMGLAPERITVIERGRDAVRLGTPSQERRQEARAQLDLGLTEADEVIVTVGRQEFQKGQRHLIEAMAMERLKDRPRLVALVAGRRGHVSHELEKLLAHHGLSERVRLLGHRDDVPQLLAAADIFVFPSLYEGLGGAVIEAMALGLPIVASDLPALREVVEPDQNALVVEPGNATQLAIAIERLLREPELAAAFAARSRAIFEQRFTLRRSAEQSIALYRRALTDHRGDLGPSM